ncbi:CinA family protein [Flavobacterium sp. MFBS3-15]|uniref:CinA family protein n=1 Tax=Flavobacterium sp. MFBS3-15 TaxID=2989816 RepID=UPI00223697B1|nr:CinA family protein [Flavobacterium sp. MFBS3-15]MCW4467658.1 CinA family protein [Flavobacterium sp. MFBS3-15]
MPSKLVSDCSKAIAAKGYSIAFIESATAGRMCSEFSLTPKSGEILLGGISCYKVFVKEKLIKVPPQLIAEHTPESAQVTQSLAEHSSKLFRSDITVAVTGLVSPGGSETPDKPVGTMFIHILYPKGFVAHAEVYRGSAEAIIMQAIDRTAELIIRELEKE